VTKYDDDRDPSVYLLEVFSRIAYLLKEGWSEATVVERNGFGQDHVRILGTQLAEKHAASNSEWYAAASALADIFKTGQFVGISENPIWNGIKDYSEENVQETVKRLEEAINRLQ
jgi:hypothetical protein